MQNHLAGTDQMVEQKHELAWRTRTQTEAPQPPYSTADMPDDTDNEGLLLTAATPLLPYLPVCMKYDASLLSAILTLRSKELLWRSEKK